MLLNITEGSFLGGPTTTIRASQVLVRGDGGTLIAVLAVIGDNGLQCVRCTDDDWLKVLAELGINERNEVVKISSKAIPNTRLFRRA